MLNHHSGIHNITDDALHYMSYYRRPQSHEQILAIIANTKSDFEPGVKAAYSNSNYILLGYIVEKVTGKSYKDALNEKIASKVGLTDTFSGGKTNNANSESNSFVWLNGKWKMLPETDMSIPGGAGAIVSTPTDLTKFITALFDGKIVSQKSLDQMKTITDGYGSGILQFPLDDKKLYGHNGGIDGFRSMLVFLPEEKLAVAYISNGTVYSVNSILLAAIAIYNNKPFTIPSFKALEHSAEELEKFVGVYASTALPLKLTISVKDKKLYGQAVRGRRRSRCRGRPPRRARSPRCRTGRWSTRPERGRVRRLRRRTGCGRRRRRRPRCRPVRCPARRGPRRPTACCPRPLRRRSPARKDRPRSGRSPVPAGC